MDELIIIPLLFIVFLLLVVWILLKAMKEECSSLTKINKLEEENCRFLSFIAGSDEYRREYIENLKKTHEMI